MAADPHPGSVPATRSHSAIRGAVSNGDATAPPAPAPAPFDLVRVLQAFVFGFPVALPLSFLATWLTARAVLGHWPRASMDDPKSLGPVVAVPYVLTEVLAILGLPLFAVALIAIAWAAWRRPVQRSELIRTSAIGLASLMVVIAMLRWDPDGIVTWFAD